MEAFVLERYGSKVDLQRQDVAEPEVGPYDVLVQVAAASVNPLDVKIKSGLLRTVLPYRPPFVMGHDLAGVVVRVGSAVESVVPGDEVFARPDDGRIGTFAELIAVPERDLALKPTSLSMEESAALPLVALTAWQALVDTANVQPGHKVLIHAGSGGVGTIAIQLAKHLGAHVAATTGTSNVSWVKDLGADVVVDYRKDDFASVLRDYDVVIDGLGGRILREILQRPAPRWNCGRDLLAPRPRICAIDGRQRLDAPRDGTDQRADPAARTSPWRAVFVSGDASRR